MDGELTYQAWATNCENELPKLLPCPFCGGEADEYEGEYGNGIYCMECGAMVGEPIHLGFDIAERVSYEQAIKAWNNRTETVTVTTGITTVTDAPQITYVPERTCRLNESSWDNGSCTWGVVCSTCGAKHEHTHGYSWNYCPSCGAKVVSE